MKKVTYTLAFATVVAILWACQKNVDDINVRPRTLDKNALSVDYSDLIGKANFMGGNSFNTTNDRINLGRVLFYDTQLSLNNTVSCGSCHKQQFAFADNVAFSDGFKGVNALRNAQPVQNISNISGTLFWDGRANSLTQLVTMPISNHIEMGFEKLELLPSKLQNISYYPELFEKAFGSQTVTIANITTALHDFISILVSTDSRLEQLQDPTFGGNMGINVWNTAPPTLTGFERIGFDVFRGKGQCANCHSGNSLEGWDAANTGLDLNYKDKGMGALNTGAEGMFRIPALRNIALTAPYMHDGRFKTLEEVIDFYDHGVQDHPNLDWRMRESSGGFEGDFGPIINPPIGGNDSSLTSLPVRRLNLTDAEKKGLVAFLKTLTDGKFVTETRFSNPFKQ